MKKQTRWFTVLLAATTLLSVAAALPGGTLTEQLASVYAHIYLDVEDATCISEYNYGDGYHRLIVCASDGVSVRDTYPNPQLDPDVGPYAWISYTRCEEWGEECFEFNGGDELEAEAFQRDPLLREATLQTTFDGCELDLTITEDGDLQRREHGSTSYGLTDGSVSLRSNSGPTLYRPVTATGTVCGDSVGQPGDDLPTLNGELARGAGLNLNVRAEQ